MAFQGPSPGSTQDRCKTAEAAFLMLYSRIDLCQAQMDNPAPPEYTVDGLTKFEYDLVEYFTKW